MSEIEECKGKVVRSFAIMPPTSEDGKPNHLNNQILIVFEDDTVIQISLDENNRIKAGFIKQLDLKEIFPS